MNKLVFLIDDQMTTQAFWQDWPEREGWDVQHLAGEMVREADAEPDEVFVRSIEERVGPNMEFFVITDGRFFENRQGGSDLLVRLAEKFQRRLVKGVVFSSEPVLEATLSTERFAKVNETDGADAVWAFLEHGATPQSLTDSRQTALSSAIHSLKDLAYPIRLDLETLKEDPGQLEVIAREYFGDGDGVSPPGYLMEGRVFEGWTSKRVLGLESCVLAVMEKLAKEHERWAEQSVLGNAHPAMMVEFNQLQHALKRVRAKVAPVDVSDLTAALAEVLRAMKGISRHLEASRERLLSAGSKGGVS